MTKNEEIFVCALLEGGWLYVHKQNKIMCRAASKVAGLCPSVKLFKCLSNSGATLFVRRDLSLQDILDGKNCHQNPFHSDGSEWIKKHVQLNGSERTARIITLRDL